MKPQADVINADGEARLLDEEMAELMFLLPTQQATELEREAVKRERTVAQVLRLLVRGFLASAAQSQDGRRGTGPGVS